MVALFIVSCRQSYHLVCFASLIIFLLSSTYVMASHPQMSQETPEVEEDTPLMREDVHFLVLYMMLEVLRSSPAVANAGTAGSSGPMAEKPAS